MVAEFLDLKTQPLEPPSKYGAYNRVSDSLVSKETPKQPSKSIVITKEHMDITSQHNVSRGIITFAFRHVNG